jgi:hypothetical protein
MFLLCDCPWLLCTSQNFNEIIVGQNHSFKSPAIAEDIVSYSCLRLVKLRAITRYIPLYPAISLFSLRYCCFRGHPLYTLSRRFKTYLFVNPIEMVIFISWLMVEIYFLFRSNERTTHEGRRSNTNKIMCVVLYLGIQKYSI